MRYLKCIVLIFVIGIITGCTAEYNIKIDKKFVNEILNVNNFDKSSWNNDNFLFDGIKYVEKIDELYSQTLSAYQNYNMNPYLDLTVEQSGVEYYKKVKISTSTNYGIRYLYKFPIDKYVDSKLLNFCYDEIEINDKNNRYDITTSKNFNCFEYYEMLDEVTVNITTSWNYSVISSNADKVENGKYTWIITKDNASNKPIRIELKKVFNWKLTLVILIPTLVIATISYFIIKKKVAKNNQI